MSEKNALKTILTVDVTLIAGLLILLSLFPTQRPAQVCDYILQIRLLLSKNFFNIASLSFFLFSGSAFVAFIMLVGGQSRRITKYNEVSSEVSAKMALWRQVISSFPFGIAFGLTLAGLACLFLLAYYISAFSVALPDSAGCMSNLQDGLGISDNVTITKTQ